MSTPRHFALALTSLGLLLPPAHAQEPCPCEEDLDAVAALLVEDYAGYPLFRERAPRELEAALADARRAVTGLEGEACDRAIRELLAFFQDGHLLLHSEHSPAVDMPPPMFFDERAPTLRPLGDDAFLVRAPSFAVHHAPALAELLERHESDLRSRPYLVVDVRGNGGGGDGTWPPLLAPLYGGPMQRWPVLWRATEGNARALEEQADMMERSGASASTCSMARGMARSMRESPQGELVSLGGSPARTATLPEVWELPRRVAILIDGSCGSSCENFLLAARQSPKVELLGARTFGAVDFQNGRIAELPSGERRLQLGMSMSTRLLEEEELHRGIAPDHGLPEEVLRDEERAVQAAYEHLRRGPEVADREARAR
jgi:hypothetical protein